MIDNHPEYLLMRRENFGVWQWVAGGGEDDETPLEAARRELEEETGYVQEPRETNYRIEPSFWGVNDSLSN